MTAFTDSFRRADRQVSDSSALSDAWIPWGQWLALVAMTTEHVARFVLPDTWGIAPWATLVGRIALPLFAGMVAWHVVYNTRDPLRYATRLLVIGLIAQVPYQLVLDLPRLNICFTLAIGILLASGLNDHRPHRLLALVGLLLIPWVAPIFEYGLPGLLLVPAFVLAFNAARWPVLAALPVLLVASQLNSLWLFSLVAILTTATLVAINLGALRQIVHVPPMPRRLWLAWYPLHFTLIAVIVPVLAWARPSL